MNNRWMLILLNILVIVLIASSIFGFTKLYFKRNFQMVSQEVQTQENDKYAYLTTQSLRSLPPLPETNQIVPTGKTKEFTLEAKESSWDLMPGIKVKAITYNGKTPGPVIRVTEGDNVKITIKNSLDVDTSIHFHGMHLPNKEDGVPPFTQDSIAPGRSFTYEFIAGHAGTYMYHPHINSVEQIDKGLYGAFVIEPQNKLNYFPYDREYTMVLAGWNVPSGSYDPKVLDGTNHTMEQTGMDGMGQMDNKDMADNAGSKAMAMDYNFWTINGKSFPATEKIKVKEGEHIRIRLINISNFAHPMHLHGTDFRIIAEDSHPLAQPRIVNTLDIAPGKTFDIDFIADNPGQWVFHCHELHHTENDGIEPGGLMTVIEYEGAKAKSHETNNNNMNNTNNMNNSKHGSMGGM